MKSILIIIAGIFMFHQNGFAQASSCGCGSGVHAGGAIPGTPGISTMSNAAATHIPYNMPFVPIVKGVTSNTKEVCPYGNCSCGASSKTTSKKISWIPLSKYNDKVNNGENVEIATNLEGNNPKGTYKQSLKFQQSNLYYLSKNNPEKSRMAAIELYENMLTGFGSQYDSQIKELIRSSLQMNADRDKISDTFKLYTSLVNDLKPEQLAVAPASLKAYRHYFQSTM